MGLSELAGRRLLELSRGEQRRVLITRALAFEPALLLLDEPASGLDTAARAQLEALLTRVGETTQIVTAAHRADQLPAVTRAVVHIAGGRINDPEKQPVRHPSTHPSMQPAPQPSSQPPQQSAAMASTEQTRHRTRVADDQDALIELDNASVWLGERRVLYDVSWRLAEAEHWLVTGDNGAGKSTFLRLLHGQLRPALGGRIRWPGLGNPGDVWSLRRRIALVSAELQAGYLYPSTVFETIASGFRSSIGLTRPVSAAEHEQVEALLVAFELDSWRDRNLRALSYGQRHRALIARMLCTEPRIVLLDEPWEGLDDTSAALVTEELSRRMHQGLQIVCASHLGPGALPLNRFVHISGGKLTELPVAQFASLKGNADGRVAPREN